MWPLRNKQICWNLDSMAWVYEFAGAVITKYLRLGGSNNPEIYCLIVLESESPR